MLRDNLEKLFILPFFLPKGPLIVKLGEIKLLLILEKEFLFNFNQSIYSNYSSKEIWEKSNKINIKFLENKNLFNENEWQELYKLSEKISRPRGSQVLFQKGYIIQKKFEKKDLLFGTNLLRDQIIDSKKLRKFKY